MALRPATIFVIALLAVAARGGTAICVLLTGHGAVVAQQASAPLLITDGESYAVYAEVIGRKAGDKPLLLNQETKMMLKSAPCGGISGRWEPEWKAVVANFIQANSTRHLLLPNRPLGRTYTLFRWAETYKRFPELRQGDWRAFYSIYGMDFGGLWGVSAVGFDATKRRAVVYVEQARGPRGTRGETHFLEKSGIDWREADWRDVGEYINVCNWVE
jgi:hypothetical protein